MNAMQVSARPATRLHYLDNLRVFLTFLVVAHHVALAYGNLESWPNWEPPADPVLGLPLDLFVLLNQAFFMGLFFLLSGYLSPGSVDRKGSGTYALDRLKRLGIPFAAFVLLLRPIYTLPIYLDLPLAERPPYWRFYLTESNIGPMWFIEVLLIFSLIYALLRRRTPGAPKSEPAPLRARQVLVFAVVLALVSYLWRIFVPVGTYVPVVGLPSAAHMPQYVMLFSAGILAYRRGWFQTLPRRTGLIGLAFVLGSLVPMAVGGYRTLDLAAAPSTTNLAHLGFALWESLFAAGVILILLRAFQRLGHRTTPVRRFLSQNAFAVYIVHAPVIVGVVALLHSLDQPPALKFLLGFVLAAPLSWSIAAGLRRIRAVRAVL